MNSEITIKQVNYFPVLNENHVINIHYWKESEDVEKIKEEIVRNYRKPTILKICFPYKTEYFLFRHELI
jgi:hypothetical protein